MGSFIWNLRVWSSYLVSEPLLKRSKRSAEINLEKVGFHRFFRFLFQLARRDKAVYKTDRHLASPVPSGVVCRAQLQW